MLDALVAAVADAFSAMTTDRPYWKGMEKASGHDFLPTDLYPRH